MINTCIEYNSAIYSFLSIQCQRSTLFGCFFIVTEDGLFCIKDYKKYIANLKMDTSKAQEHFDYMLIDEDRTNNENALNSDRFKATVYDFWVSMDPNRYMCTCVC